MKIIYCHHAERDVDDRKLRNQNDDITENGAKDAELVSEMFADQKITAIYTSSFYRCKKTAQIINRKIGAPIYEEDRFNEVGSYEGEEWKDCLVRNINALNDIASKYNDDDVILCVTSGINLSAFVCWNLKEKPHKDFPFMGATNVSPIMFYDVSTIKYRERWFDRPRNANEYKRNKDYKIIDPTPGEARAQLKLELKRRAELMEIFTQKLRREDYILKSGELERARDLGEIEIKKYLSNKLSIEIMQLLKDIASVEGIEESKITTTTALELTEDQCIQNFAQYTERLFYVDTNILDTLLLLYSTLVSYINYNDLVYEDICKTCVIVEKEEGNYLQGKYIYKLN
jgi:broad specificity phosphatase PhoE